MTTLSDIGSLLRSYRKQLGLSQTELAARCKIHRNTLSALENGMGNIELNSLLAICGQLGLELSVVPSKVAYTVQRMNVHRHVPRSPDSGVLWPLSPPEPIQATSFQTRIAERIAAAAGGKKREDEK